LFIKVLLTNSSLYHYCQHEFYNFFIFNLEAGFRFEQYNSTGKRRISPWSHGGSAAFSQVFEYYDPRCSFVGM